ncbi:hypothetical protein J7L06_08845 [Candidatus Bathyarchaeota archaeon]|nr:hypothetical protein [Candidatus Bathyarchaeota archaeon]
MNGRERSLIALDLSEPDRVPITELSIDLTHLEKIYGKPVSVKEAFRSDFQLSSDRRLEKLKLDMKIECYRKLGFDLITCGPSAPENYKPKKNENGTIVDELGRILIYDQRCRTWIPYRGIFNAPEDVERYQFPDPQAPGRTFAIEYMSKKVGEELLVAGAIRDPFAYVWEMFTPINFVRWMYYEPRIIDEAMKRLTEFNVKIIELLVDSGAELIISSGDYCEKKGAMVPISFFREKIFPNLRKQVNAAHRRGVKFIKHTDGNINPILDDLSHIVDGLHSLDPSAGVDIGFVKEKYGDKLILMGNVSVDTLSRGSREDVVRETKECIRKASPGGGHFLSSSNSWYTDAKLENCLTMVETGRKYGRYPINI